MLVAVLVFLSVYLAVDLFGRRQEQKHADIICVFGAAVWGTTPSPELAARIHQACQLYREGFSPLIFLSGGPTGGALSEPDVMANAAVQEGVPRSSLVLDVNGISTACTVQDLRDYMEDNHLGSCLMVSSPFHMARIMMLTKLYGVQSYSSPPRETPLALDPSKNAQAVLREELALFKDLLVFLLARGR